MITAAEIRRYIAELEKKPKASRQAMQRLLGDTPRVAEKSSGGVKALELLVSSKTGSMS